MKGKQPRLRCRRSHFCSGSSIARDIDIYRQNLLLKDSQEVPGCCCFQLGAGEKGVANPSLRCRSYSQLRRQSQRVEATNLSLARTSCCSLVRLQNSRRLPLFTDLYFPDLRIKDGRSLQDCDCELEVRPRWIQRRGCKLYRRQVNAKTSQ